LSTPLHLQQQPGEDPASDSSQDPEYSSSEVAGIGLQGGKVMYKGRQTGKQ
jgi:hypothetical protein